MRLLPFESPTPIGPLPDLVRREQSLWLDVKTGAPNIAISVAALEFYELMQTRFDQVVRIVHAPTNNPEDWTVSSTTMLRRRQLGGIRQPNGRSACAWYLFKSGGVPLFDYIGPRPEWLPDDFGVP